MPPENLRHVTDVSAMRALANPVRYRIFGHLMAQGPRTASECAAVVGASPSNCSYHLRELGRYGLVERVEDGVADGRERRWRSTATGYRFGPRDGEAADPAARFASVQLAHLGIEDESALAHAAIDAHVELEAPWQAAETMATYGLGVTAEELRELGSAVDNLLRPFIGLTRDGAPTEARAVHASFRAFVLPGDE